MAPNANAAAVAATAANAARRRLTPIPKDPPRAPRGQPPTVYPPPREMAEKLPAAQPGKLPPRLQRQVDAGTMTAEGAASRFQRFQAGQLPGQQGASAPPQPAPGDASGRMEDLVRSLPPGGSGGRFNMAGGDLYRAYPPPPGQGGPPPGAPEPGALAGALPGAAGALGPQEDADPRTAALRAALGPALARLQGGGGGEGGGLEFQTGGGLQAPQPGQAEAMARLRAEDGAMASAFGQGAGVPGKGPAPMPGQGGVMNIPPMNASDMLAYGPKPFFGDISQMPGQPGAEDPIRQRVRQLLGAGSGGMGRGTPTGAGIANLQLAR